MQSTKLSVGLMTVVVVALAVFATAACAVAQQEAVLHSFNNNGRDGYTPYAALIRDPAGNLYGTTSYGPNNGGTVFELIPQAGGGWAEKVLHSFSGSTDGSYPRAGLTFDAVGNLYGTTYDGGAYGYGTVFELMCTEAGNCAEKILHDFNDNGTDAFNPDTNLVFDTTGNLYGTTQYGGKYNSGTVYELTPTTGGRWTEKILHSFNNRGTDGYYPLGAVIFVAGNLYGTTHYGGTSDNGTVFELIPKGGAWAEKIVHNFDKDGTDGFIPIAGLISDSSGKLYGTTELGGNGANCSDDACGTAFELESQPNGTWTETILHNFSNNGTDGFNPYAGLTLGAEGNLYGATPFGGGGTNCGGGGCGIAFELIPGTGGIWTETLLHDFGVGSNDASGTYAGLIIDASGNLYGTTYGGGIYGYGTVFEIKP